MSFHRKCKSVILFWHFQKLCGISSDTDGWASLLRKWNPGIPVTAILVPARSPNTEESGSAEPGVFCGGYKLLRANRNSLLFLP